MNEDISTEKCYLCGSHTEVLYNLNQSGEGKYSIIKCNICDLMRIFPIPSDEEIKRFYSNEIISPVIKKSEVFNSQSLEKLKEIFIIKPLLKSLYNDFSVSKKPTLLDVGCSTGWITSVARQVGFEVKGLEINSNSAKIAREKYGLKIYEGSIEDLDTNKSFDSIIMMHVLEHLIDPLNILKKVYNLLAENGILLIVIPNSDSLGTKIFRRYYNWNAPLHLNFFNKHTIKTVLQKADFKIYKISDLSSPPLILYSFGNFLKERVRYRILTSLLEFHTLGNLLAFPLAFAGRLVRKPEVIAVYARKV